MARARSRGTTLFGIDPLAILIRVVINTIAILVAAKLIDGIHLRDWQGAVLAGALFGIVNSLIKPAVRILTCPLYILTMGLFALVVNALMLALTSWIAQQEGIGFRVDGFAAAFTGAIVAGIVAWLAALVIPGR